MRVERAEVGVATDGAGLSRFRRVVGVMLAGSLQRLLQELEGEQGCYRPGTGGWWRKEVKATIVRGELSRRRALVRVRMCGVRSAECAEG